MNKEQAYALHSALIALGFNPTLHMNRGSLCMNMDILSANNYVTGDVIQTVSQTAKEHGLEAFFTCGLTFGQPIFVVFGNSSHPFAQASSDRGEGDR